MRFAVLGPLGIHLDSRDIVLTAGRERTLLAMLLLYANRPVSVDQLIDAIWPSRLPRDARNQLQLCVAQLRRRLKSVGIDRTIVVTEPGGYRVTVGPDELDLFEFRQLVMDARAAASKGRIEDATTAYHRALNLWRGQALADVESPLVRQAALTLDDERVHAVEEYAEVALTVDTARDAHAEIDRLIQRYPYRETLHRAKMLALYRGRQYAEALDAYREVRRQLREELGAEPCRDLQELHRAILNRDPRLGGRSSVTTLPAPPVPRQLPPDIPSFSGRSETLRALDELLPGGEHPAGPVVISAIAGTAGVGKTALAVHWAHAVASRFPDGQLYVNLRGFDPGGVPVEPVVAVRRFLDALHVPPERIPPDLDAQIGLYRSLVAERRLLVVLDNARDAEQVRPLLPGAPGCMVLVTSRSRLSGLVVTEGAIPVLIDVLPAEEARQLLAERLGGERLAAEPEAVAELVTACAGLPLALAIVAAQAAARPDFPLSVVADDVRQAGAGLEPWAGMEATADLRAVFSWSYDALDQDIARLFRLLGLHPGIDIATAAAASLAGVPIPEARRMLTSLSEANLVIEQNAGRYTLHDLLRAYATELTETIDSVADRKAAQRRLQNWYLQTALSAADHLYPEMVRLPSGPASPSPWLELAGSLQAREWLEAERANLIQVIANAAEHGHRPLAWQLAHALRGFWGLGSYLVDGQTAATHALAAARHEADVLGQASAELSLGAIRHYMGRHSEAQGHYETAAELARKAGWAEGQTTALSNAAVSHALQGRLDRAVANLAEATAILRTLNLRGPLAINLSNLGVVYHELGRLDQASHCFTESLALFRGVGASGSACAVPLHNLGGVARDLGRLDEAHDHATEAVDLCREQGSRIGEANALNTLATVLHHIGQYREASAAAQAAARLAVDIGDRNVEAVARNTLGTVHRSLKNPEQALRDHGLALALAREAHDPSPEFCALLGLAAAHHDLGDHELARSLATEARNLARERGYRLNEGNAMILLADIYLSHHEYVEASGYACGALDLHRDTGYRYGEARAHLILGYVREHAGDVEGARRDWQRAHTKFVEVSAPEAAQTASLLIEGAQHRAPG